RSAIRAGEEHFDHRALRLHALEQYAEWHAGPLSGADRTELPLLAGRGRFEVGAAIARALQRDEERSRRERAKVVDRKAQRVRHEAADRQMCGRRWDREVIADVVLTRRGDRAADEVRSQLGVERLAAEEDPGVRISHVALRRMTRGPTRSPWWPSARVRRRDRNRGHRPRWSRSDS